MTTVSTGGSACCAGSRMGSRDVHSANNVMDGVVGDGVVTTMGQSCSLWCGGEVEVVFIGWSHVIFCFDFI